jgi:hypothetical protein
MTEAPVPHGDGPVAGATGPAVERQLAFDMIRRALPVAPLLVGLALLVRGIDGGLSAGYAIVLVLANFALSAALLSWAARVSIAVLMAAALFGYLIRLGLVALAVLAVRNQAWVDLVSLGLTLVATHLGLLFWETKHVSASLAFPGLKPVRAGRD